MLLRSRKLAHDAVRRQRQELIESLHPAPGTEPLQFSSKFARTVPEQFLIILRKFFALYNRMLEYNAGQHIPHAFLYLPVYQLRPAPKTPVTTVKGILDCHACGHTSMPMQACCYVSSGAFKSQSGLRYLCTGLLLHLTCWLESARAGAIS